MFTGVSWFRWQGVSGIIAFTLGERKPPIPYEVYLPVPKAPSTVILQLRLYALYSLNRKVMAAMGSVFVGTVVASATIMGFVLANIEGPSASPPAEVSNWL